MKAILSASARDLCGDMTAEECIDLLSEAGYTAMDFWLNKYCEKADGPMLQPDWRQFIGRVREYADKKGIAVGQVHAHWRLGTEIREDFSCDAPSNLTLNNIEACAMLNSRRLVFHPLQRWLRMPDEADRRKVLDANVRYFGALLPAAEKYGVEIHIENLFDHHHVWQEEDPVFPFGQTEDILYLLDRLNSPRVKTCLDTGHANINGVNIPAAIRAYGKRLGSLHLNDNFGRIRPVYEDLHLFPGNGRLDWKAIIRALREVEYEGTFNFECSNGMKSMTRGQRLVGLRFAREMFEQMLRDAEYEKDAE